MRGVTLAVIVALAARAYGERRVPTFGDLLESLNTTSQIWKTVQNYTKQYDCTAATKEFLNGTMYKFNQTYRDGQKEVGEELYANFEEGGEVKPPVMKVSRNPGGPGIPYTLQFWNRQEMCGILTFTNPLNGEARCEKHVWNENVGSETPNCEENYKDICGGEKHVVYTSSCKTAAS